MAVGLQSVQASFTQNTLLVRAFAAIDASSDISNLLSLVGTVVDQMFKREADTPHREKAVLAMTSYFYAIRDGKGMTDSQKMVTLRKFSKELLQIVNKQRPLIAQQAPVAPIPGRRATDGADAPAPPAALDMVTDLLDTSLGVSEVEKPTDIKVLEQIAPAKFDNFKDLFTAALQYRLSGVTRFFQRENSGLERELVKPFLLTAEFEAKFMTVVAKIIVPKMYAGSRNIAMLESSQNWSRVTSASFWSIVDGNEKTRLSIIATWEEAWNSCRQRETLKPGTGGESRRVLTALPELKEIREILEPNSPESYEIPPIRNAELELFSSMLYGFDIYRLEHCFNKLRQLYEQEMDRRWYQDKARQGALRDSLLDAIDAFPDRTGDFLALLCYYCFPNTDIFFLEKFTHNKGANRAQRIERLPTLMRFLAGNRVEEISRQEMQEKREREDAAKAEMARERELDRERSARI